MIYYVLCQKKDMQNISFAYLFEKVKSHETNGKGLILYNN